MTWFDVVVFMLSGAGAIAALVSFVWAAREGHPAMRQVYTAAAGLCIIYIASYAVVLSGAIVPAEWSKYMRPVSLAFWWVALVAPTCGAVLIHRGTKRGLAEFAGRPQ